MAYRETAQVKARKAAQREALLRTAETLVRDGGFAAMTMQTVADRAGVGVGTLYRYFDNKATLAAAVFAVATQREVDAVDRALAGGGDASARLERALRLFARRALAAPRLAWALIAEPVEPEVVAERLRYRAAYAALYQRVLDQGVAAGELPPQSTALAAAALWAMGRWGFIWTAPVLAALLVATLRERRPVWIAATVLAVPLGIWLAVEQLLGRTLP